MTSKLLAAGVLLAAVATPTHADWTDFSTQCSSGAIRTCASFQAQVDPLSGGRTRLVIRVRNLWGVLSDGSIRGSILAQLGVVAPDLSDVQHTAPVAVGGAGLVGNPESRWGFRRSTARLGSVEWAVAAGDGRGSNGNGGIYGCLPTSPRNDYFTTCVDGQPGGWVEFSLTSAGPIDIAELEIAWGAIAIDGAGGDDSRQGTTCVGGCAAEVVPEPVTLVLLGSGLAGVAGAARRRRRTNPAGPS